MATKQGSSPKLRRSGKHKHAGKDGNNHQHNKQAAKPMSASEMCFHQPTNTHVGSKQAIVRQRGLERLKTLHQEGCKAAASHRSVIAINALVALNKVVFRSKLAGKFAAEIVAHYGETPVGTTNAKQTAYDLAFAKLTIDELKQDKALAAGKHFAFKAIEQAFDAFHATFTPVKDVEEDSKAELAAAS